MIPSCVWKWNEAEVRWDFRGDTEFGDEFNVSTNVAAKMTRMIFDYIEKQQAEFEGNKSLVRLFPKFLTRNQFLSMKVDVGERQLVLWEKFRDKRAKERFAGRNERQLHTPLSLYQIHKIRGRYSSFLMKDGNEFEKLLQSEN
jgi:hypothetical protein